MFFRLIKIVSKEKLFREEVLLFFYPPINTLRTFPLNARRRRCAFHPKSAIRVLTLFCALFFCLPSTSRRRSGQDFFFLYIFVFSPNHPILCFSPGKKNFPHLIYYFSWAGVFSHHASKILTISRCQSTALRQSDLD